MSWLMPFPEKAITGEFGTMSEFRRKRGMQAHSGTDWSPAGSNKGKTPIPAVAKGTIKLIQWSNVLGWVVVQTAMDKDRKVKYIGYCHISCGKHGVNCKGPKVHGDHMPIKKKVGDKLAAGDTVAIMGNTGSASSGVHLHATLSNRLKGVFGATSDKQDLKKAILANRGVAPKAKPVAQPATPAPKVEATKPAPTVTAVPAVSAAPRVVTTPAFHKVVSGDTLSGIAAKYDTTVSALIRLNGIPDANKIFVGQMIRLGK
jgi:murein DD-endopeptidase MepM/ murein hydrolase activator NlpD